MSTKISINYGGSASTQSLTRPQVELPNQIGTARKSDAVKDVQTVASADIKIDPKNLSEAIAKLNERLRNKNSYLSFSLNESLGRTVITVKNEKSGEVVRQIPDEAVVTFVENLEKMKGLIFSKKV
jgi:uncharacterized FlaG/YvyC family protein